MRKGILFEGMTFRGVTLLRKGPGLKWFCSCPVCGSETLRTNGALLDFMRGDTQHWVCTCFGKRSRHGMTGTPTMITWEGMIQRCHNPNATKYETYGGRGITVCARWRVFKNFLEDMGLRPAGTTLDRIDSNGNYEPGNCRWASQKDQTENTRRIVRVIYEGREYCLKEACKAAGVNYDTIRKKWKKSGEMFHRFEMI